MSMNRQRPMLAIIAAIAMAFLAACGSQPRPVVDAGEVRGSGGINTADQRNKPYLVLVSIDGFRWDYMDRYPTPNMHRLLSSGSRAERAIPVFPTLTFPNHYSIATGLYPAHHGLVANDFPDPARGKWYSLKDREAVEDRWFYSGEPIWVTAETQGMVAASFFFVGTEAPIMGVSPSYWRSYDQGIAGEDRVDQVLAWMALPPQRRPHLYTLYFEDVDDSSHWKGPDSAATIAAVKRLDDYVGRLLDGIEKLPYAGQVNIMLVSDHGLAAYLDNPRPFILDAHVPIKDTAIIEGGSYLFMHFERDDPVRAQGIADTVNASWQHGHAYTPASAPGQWHIDSNPRFPDVMLVAEVGYAVISTPAKHYKITAGDHGWAPEAPEMHGFFVTSGPNINPGITLGPISNVDIYPLMLDILGLDAPTIMDGDPGTLARIVYWPGRAPDEN